MTDRELEARLRAWYADGDQAVGAAPADLRESLAAIPAVTPAPRPAPNRRRGLTLLAVAAVLVVGGAVAAAGSGLLRLTSVVPPTPSQALLASPGPSPAETPETTPSPTANIRPGERIAFTGIVDKDRPDCSRLRTSCPTSRVWIVGADGQGAHELVPDGSGNQFFLGWSPDGTRLLYMEDGVIYLTDGSGGTSQPLDTGCPPQAVPTASTCQSDTQTVFSPDGRHIAFVRDSIDDNGYWGISAITTMDLENGRIAVLDSTTPAGGSQPGWSPDGSQIVFSRWGEKGPDGELAAIFTIGANGQDMRQVNPATLAALDASWSPDGSRIVFVSPRPYDPQAGSSLDVGDIYTIRPDGSDVRQLTTDGSSTSPAWTADGRILFTRVSGSTAGDPGWWTMDADGTHTALFLSPSDLGLTPEAIRSTKPSWQPLGGAAIVPPPWTPAQPIAVGPPPPTPAPTATPDLAPGFAWTGAPTSDANRQLGETATVLDDGRVLVTQNCGTAAELYDPGTGTFSPTGSLGVVRSSGTATLLLDGRVLFAGGYNCAAAGQDGMWASAELYDPATGTFSPTGSMTAPRSQHTATLLADGRVLIAGGLTGSSPAAAGAIRLASYRLVDVDAFLASAEIYDPTTGTFSKTGSMTTPHRGHTSTLLQDGRVLVIGNGGESSSAGTTADLYDPTTGKWSRTGSLDYGRWLQTATLLKDGRVLVLGGRTSKDSVRATAELYDPRTGEFSAAGSMTEGRQQHTATLLEDGRVLIAGGWWSDGSAGHMLSSTETYDPATGTFSPTGSMGAPRNNHWAVRLNGGRVLIVGGEDTGAPRAFWAASAVLYTP